MALLLSIIILVASSIICLRLLGHFPWIRNIFKSTINNRPGKTVPEATGSWPIIGHLHLLTSGSQLPHKLLGSMADKFGPIFTIKLGVHRVLIVSNSEMAKECLTINDRLFASRPKAIATEVMGYNYANLGFAPNGPYWREMRKIIALELGSHHRLQMLAQFRASEVKYSIIDIYRTWIRNKGSSETVMVDMQQWFGNLIVNMVLKMVFGNSFPPGQRKEDFKKVIRRFMDLLGVFVPSDVIPGVRWLDVGGYEKKMKKTAKDIDDLIGGCLEEYKKMKSSSEQQEDIFMAAFLSHVKELKEDLYGFDTDTIVKATCLAILGAAGDSTIVTLTWALALLANNRQVLQKAQQELENHVGRDRNVQESDLKNLVYLQAIIKETMRLYPAGPLMVPHESTEDCIVAGYNIPKGTRLFVNVWKIQHDPQIWTDPFEFQPDRFLTSEKEIDLKGQHFELIPFGSGRRICPAISFALQSLEFILASIIHGFEFHNLYNEPIDMTEGHGIANLKATPLELLVAPRLSPHLYGVSA